MICCTFAGHRNIIHGNIEEKVLAALTELAEKGNEFTFYTGGMGEFDALCARCVRKIRHEHPEKLFRLVLVVPYMTQSINRDGQLLSQRYDDVIIPETSSTAHYKSAIELRNRWMVDRCQYMLAYVCRDHGGAFKTLRYALKKGLTIYNIE